MESTMPRSPLRARSQISWSGDTLIFVLPTCYEMLGFWIEYAYLLETKMSCCSVQASRALLSGSGYVLSEVVVCCLSIVQHAPVLKREPRSVPQVRPYGRTVLKSRLRWSTTWWRGAAFWRRRPVDHWVLAGWINCWVLTGGIDYFLIATPNHDDYSGFVVRISLRTNSDDWVVVDGVLIDGHAGPSNLS
jgi:hypothetical protein